MTAVSESQALGGTGSQALAWVSSHGFGHPSAVANMLRIGQRDMGHGSHGLQGSLNHLAALPSVHQPMLHMQAQRGMISETSLPGNSNIALGMVPTQDGGPRATQAGRMGTGGVTAQSPGPPQYDLKHRCILFLRHCGRCQQSETECPLNTKCTSGKQFLQHISKCTGQGCPYPRCQSIKKLLRHHWKCKDHQCPICGPVRMYACMERMQRQQAQQQQQQAQQQQQLPQQPQQSPLPPPPTMAGHPGVQQPDHPMVIGQQPLAPLGPTTPRQQCGIKRPHDAMSNGPLPGGMPQQQHGMPQQQHGMPQQQHGMQPDSQQAPELVQGPPGDEQQAKRLKAADEPVQGKSRCASLLETFTMDQIMRHKDLTFEATRLLRETQTQPANKADLCPVCQCTRLLYEPPALYCSTCSDPIERNKKYWAAPAGQQDSTVKGCWCNKCYTAAKPHLPLPGVDPPVKKADLRPHTNNKEVEEHDMVQCDKCAVWVHHVCGLFNKGCNTAATRFLCPDCLLEGLQRGERQPRPQVPACKDLPRCELSDFLEARLKAVLEQEHMARAHQEGLPPDKVPTAESLTLRVVNNVVKKCEVKQRFREAFGQASYPYRQRVLVLFQQQDGVDVCLFIMYVHEYGEDCPEPNRNCVYLSYLDSVQHFRPELKAVVPPTPGGGRKPVALRTFVYQQIQIGYLSYVKMLGYKQMYIWACPPNKGDDYILHCHPDWQKTPDSKKLCNWYQGMLHQAKAEGIVVHTSTLWDTYFKERCSVTAMPYLEGDNWPEKAEEHLAAIMESQSQANKNSGAKGRGTAGRAAKVQRRTSAPGTIDEQLMARLEETLGGQHKENFIVVHLQEVCTPQHLSGETIQAQATAGYRDPDPDMENEFFDLRTSFLSLCQGNHYQFNSLRHAKHSSMMILYHLFNPQEPAFTSTCNLCSINLAPGAGFRCTVCPDFDVCGHCKNNRRHEHELVTLSRYQEMRINKVIRERQEREGNLQRTLGLLLHACSCNNPSCSSSACRKVQGLLSHWQQCRLQPRSNCQDCRKMQPLLVRHARSCTTAECQVPSCKDYKELLRRQAARQEEKRRVAYQLMHQQIRHNFAPLLLQ